jgi:hypothetical protein
MGHHHAIPVVAAVARRCDWYLLGYMAALAVVLAITVLS